MLGLCASRDHRKNRGDPTEATLRSDGPAATEALGEALGRAARDGDVLLLTGDLGAGKTCMTRGIARGAGYQGPVRSPTFAVMHEYKGQTTVFHLDLYRGNAELLEDTGVLDVLGYQGICVIEWGEKAAKELERTDIHPLMLDIRSGADADLSADTRLIRASSDGLPGDRLLAGWLKEMS